MDKLTKLIEDAERAEQGDWHYISDSLFDSERWNGQVAVVRSLQIVSRICECEEDSGVHIANMQPSKILPILRAFQEMLEVLRDDHSQACPIYESARCECHYESKVEMAKLHAVQAIDNL